MMEQRGLSRSQKLILIAMALTLVSVLAALGSMIRGGVPDSPIPIVTSPVSLTATTSLVRVTSRPDPPTPTSPSSTPTSEAPDILAARRIVELGRDVGQLRELPKQQEIPLNFVSAEEMADYLRQIRAGSGRRAFVERQQELLAALDLLPDPDEAFPPTVHTRARHVIAFYDPLEAQIFLGPAGRNDEQPDISLIHQYAHAFIDQHFDLRSVSLGAANADAGRARDALVEGDAMAVLALHQFGGVDPEKLDDLAHHLADVEVTDYEGYLSSRAMSDVFVFPYREGALFVAALLDVGWWPAVNAAYLDPPISTEQILHPEKYIENPRDVPRTVRLPDLNEDLDGEWGQIAQDVLGELILRAHLDQYLPDSSEAQAAAAGWDGDLAALWSGSDDRQVFLMRILWDSPDEAAEFARSYVTVVDRRLEGARRVIRSIVPRDGRWWRGEGGNAYLQQRDNSVLVIWAPDSETMEQVLAVFVFE